MGDSVFENNLLRAFNVSLNDRQDSVAYGEDACLTYAQVSSPSAQSHSAHDNSVSALRHRKGMAITSLNVNSLLLHIDEIRTLVMDLGIHILAINETKFDGTIDEALVGIDGYFIKRCDRNRNVGGVAICIKDSIVDKCSICVDLPESSLASL